jgi:hypothetical protein
MREPRCGNKDLRRIQRRKRYILQGIRNFHINYEIFFSFPGSRWPSNEPLTFRIIKYPTTFPQQFVDTELTKALKVYFFCLFILILISKILFFFCLFSYGVVHQVLNLNIEN